jgi:hypothetical protein
MNKLYKKILSLGFGCFILAISTSVSFASGIVPWTPEKDQRLRFLMEKYGLSQWRTAAPWTPEEDQRLRSLVEAYGTNNWSTIATEMPGRIGKHCQERWRNHLNPSSVPSAWTPEEDDLLVCLVGQHGFKWNLIAGFFHNRSESNCKNRWNSKLKRMPFETPSPLQSLLRKVAPSLLRKDSKQSPVSQEFQAELASQGLKVEWDVASAFGEDLCGYSALFAALKLAEIDPEVGGNIIIKHQEVRDFAEFLKETLELSKSITIGAPLDIDHLGAIAQFMGYHVILETETPYEFSDHYRQDFNPDAPMTIKIYLRSGGNGHYQIITPRNVTVQYKDDLPGVSRLFSPVSFSKSDGFFDVSGLGSFLATPVQVPCP